MDMKKSNFFKTVILSLIFSAAASSVCATESVENLLTGYLGNDLTLKNLSYAMSKTMLEKKVSDIDKGFSFKLSTGTITFSTTGNGSVKFTPSASFSLPQASNLGISVSSTILFDSLESTDVFSGTSLKVSADIISSTAKTRQVSLLKSQRTVLEAQRNLQNGFVKAEKDFYTDLKTLYNLWSQVVSAEKSLYDSKLDFEKIKAQGYAVKSTKYRTAQMEVLDNERNVEKKRRELDREVTAFAAKCGIEYSGSAEDFLPATIPGVEAVDVNSFSPDSYTKVESAKWTQYINDLARSAESAVTLTGNAGFTFNNSQTSSNTVDVGTDFTWNSTGLKVSTGAALPVGGESFNLVFTLGLSFDPNAFRTAKINSEIKAVEAEQESVAIQSALAEYKTQLVSRNSSLEDIKWEAETVKKSYEMYESLEADMKSYYLQGIVTESEYKSAQVNKESYRLKLLINSLDLIIYNDETTLLFCRDEELTSERKKITEESDGK